MFATEGQRVPQACPPGLSPVPQWLGEDLQQYALVVLVNQDAVLLTGRNLISCQVRALGGGGVVVGGGGGGGWA
jgi:hypothetical protein